MKYVELTEEQKALLHGGQDSLEELSLSELFAISGGATSGAYPYPYPGVKK